MSWHVVCAPASTGALVPNERSTRKLLCTAEPLQQNDGGGAPRARGVGPAHTSTPEQSKAKRESHFGSSREWFKDSRASLPGSLVSDLALAGPAVLNPGAFPCSLFPV